MRTSEQDLPSLADLRLARDRSSAWLAPRITRVLFGIFNDVCRREGILGERENSVEPCVCHRNVGVPITGIAVSASTFELICLLPAEKFLTRSSFQSQVRSQPYAQVCATAPRSTYRQRERDKNHPRCLGTTESNRLRTRPNCLI